MSGRVMIVFHGMLPRPGRPVVGNGLRARALGQGCKAAGFEVFYAATHLGEAPDPSWPETLKLYPYAPETGLRPAIDRINPDVLILLQVEELKDLPPLRIPVVADLFAPRVLEAQYQDMEREGEVIQRIAALTRADAFLCTNGRQRQYYLAWLLMAGVDVRQNPLRVVPLGVDPETPEREEYPDEARFVAGGVGWPWIENDQAISTLLQRLEERARGSLELYGGQYLIAEGGAQTKEPDLPSSKRLRKRGMIPYDELLVEYRQATAALDIALPNAERELALSFRTLDYLVSGLPVIVPAHSVIAHTIAVAEAGWIVDPADPDSVGAAVDQVLDDPEEVKQRGARARALALERFAWDKAAAPLVELLREGPVRRERRPSLIRTVADIADRALAERREHQLTEQRNQKLSDENREVRTSLDRTVEELKTVREQVRLKDDALVERGRENDALELKRSQLTQDLDNARNEVIRLERELGALRPKHEAADKLAGEAEGLKKQRDDLLDKREQFREELNQARRAAEAAQTEAERQRVGREGEARRADDAHEKMKTLATKLDEAERKLEDANKRLELSRPESDAAAARLKELEVDNQRLQEELDRAAARLTEEIERRDAKLEDLGNQLERTKGGRDHSEQRVVELESQLDEERRRLDAARHELSAAQRELAAIQANPVYQLGKRFLRK